MANLQIETGRGEDSLVIIDVLFGRFKLHLAPWYSNADVAQWQEVGIFPSCADNIKQSATVGEIQALIQDTVL